MRTKRMLVLTAMVLLIALALCACGKNPITKEDFVSKAQALGYEIEDNTPTGDTDYSYVKSSTLATKKDVSDDNWFVMFVVAETKNDAEEMFNYNRDEYANGVSTNVSESSSGNSASYSANKDGKYLYACYADTTMLLVEVDASYKDEAKKLISELGY